MRYSCIPVLLSLPLALGLVAGVAVAQLPQRATRPTTVDPTAPPLPTTDPGVPSTDPKLGGQPVVAQPGTTLQQPGPLRTREIRALNPGQAPGAVQVTATGPRSVTLSWQAPAGASGYWVYKAGAGQTEYYSIGSLWTEPTATVTGLLPAATYSFKVSAVYPHELQRDPGMSEAVSATTGSAPAPTGLTASLVGRGQISLTWDGLPGADGFRLFRNGERLADIKPLRVIQGGPGPSAGGPATLPTTFGDSVPLAGTYLYQIQAVYLAVGVDKSAEAVSALAPTPPVSVTIQPSTRVKYCQARADAVRCTERGASPVTIAANTLVRAVGRRSP